MIMLEYVVINLFSVFASINSELWQGLMFVWVGGLVSLFFLILFHFGGKAMCSLTKEQMDEIYKMLK